jgi:2-hydroxy-6-oxonona-2,4-dienedioate hydrolase
VTALGDAAAEWVVSRRVRAGGREVRYHEAGSGSPLVLVHGLGCSADYWMRNGPVLAAAGYRVLAPDLPGFGRTRGPRAGLSIPAQARAIAGWADALRLEPAAYVGHSLSCQTVVELAAREPSRAAALVLAAPTGDRRDSRRIREALGLIRDIPREPMGLVPWVLDAYLRAGAVRWARTWWSGKRHDLFAAAARVEVPALVVVGQEDPVVSERFAGSVAQALPRGELHIVEGAAHAVIFDAADAFNAAVLAFLNRAQP